MALRYTSDILVIGTGSAGLRAAIEAEAHGSKAILTCKAPAGYNNCTIVAGSGYLAAVGGMSIEEHMMLTFTTGKGVNDPNMVKVLAEEGAERVLELEDYGCKVNVHRGIVHVGDENTVLGQGITLPMLRYVKERGVEVADHVIISRLLKCGDRVVGAVGYNSRLREPAVFQSKAVILSSGGAGALYKRTDCPLRTTGDGYSLAYHAGARLRDMEFNQFFPLALAEPGVPNLLVDGKMVEKGKIINSLGEDIPKKYGVTERPYIAKSRDLLSRAMMMEILNSGDPDGAVFIDGREVMKESKSGDSFGMADYDFYINVLQADERPIRVAPLSHFTMGGIVTNMWGETGVEGLFAAGEVAGGVHGANRHGGNALTDTVVFGARAGAKASEYVNNVGHLEVDELAKLEFQRYETMARRETGFTPPTLMNILRGMMWENVGIVRDSYKLVEAYDKVAELRDSVKTIMAQPGRQLAAALEVPMALDAAEMIIRAAMKRRESRGAHYRTDHPEEDPSWVKTIIIRKKGEAMELKTTPVGEAFE
jgi:succinate dehydrogenase/fumarate reductase flavoprotein subunit